MRTPGKQQDRPPHKGTIMARLAVVQTLAPRGSKEGTFRYTASRAIGKLASGLYGIQNISTPMETLFKLGTLCTIARCPFHLEIIIWHVHVN